MLAGANPPAAVVMYVRTHWHSSACHLHAHTLQHNCWSKQRKGVGRERVLGWQKTAVERMQKSSERDPIKQETEKIMANLVEARCQLVPT